MDDIDILDVLEYRRIVEKSTAAVAAERATDEDLAEIQAVYDQMIQGKDNVANCSRADLEFHLAVAKATGNPVIIKDVAGAALYLASDEAAFINGVAFPVDGAVTAW